MFCPLCKAEYRPGSYRCADCDVPLVDALPQEAGEVPSFERAEEASPVLLWRGGNPVVYAAILGALGEAGIPFYDFAARDYEAQLTSLFPVSSTPGFDIWVFRAHSAAASRILEAVIDQASAEQATEMQGQESPALAPVADRNTPKEWDPERAVVEAWSGEDVSLMQFVADALRENDIPSRSLDEPSGPKRIFVQPEDASRARKIIREVLEGAPPA